MGSCTKNLEKFCDNDQCISLIDDLEKEIHDDRAEKLVETFKTLVDKYQEQPELLEPYLPDLIRRLTSNLKTPQEEDKESLVRYHAKFKYLYQLVKVVGFKSVGKRFPHEAENLPLIVKLLEKESPDNKQHWQTRFVLTVWLSIVIMTPFDLRKFDAGSQEQTQDSMSRRVFNCLQTSLSSHDSCQHVTAYCLAKFFSRPDLLAEEKLLNEFFSQSLGQLRTMLDGCHPSIKNLNASQLNSIRLIGELRTLAYMYKFLPRPELQRRSGALLSTIGHLNIEKVNGELMSHLLVKLVQRLGLALLPKRVASWRAKRGARILGAIGQQQDHQKQQQQQQKLDASESQSASRSPPASEPKSDKRVIDRDADILMDESAEKEAEVEEEEFKLENISTDWLESILSTLFVAAQNGQTKIRWSAAKGIARVASRLDRRRAGDVIDMVLGNFFDAEASNEFAWHGGCLTLAEMSRQGLVLVEKLNLVINVIQEAIVYDKIKGSFAVGAHVREAACYVIWAMARTYDDHHLGPYVSKLSINLMCTIVFDRELQCRRAASATFQELIGRQGAFDQEALGLLSNVDYQNVGIRQFAYLELASRVARIGGPKYYEQFIEHLLVKKLPHWDVQIRRLASDSLGSLMLYPSEEFIEKRVLGQLFELLESGGGKETSKLMEQTTDNNLKHGCLLGLAQVIKSLVPLGFKFSDQTRQFVGKVHEYCSKQLKIKQQAGNFLEAICLLISASELAKFDYDSESPKTPLILWEQIVFQALDSDNAELRALASDSYLSLYRFHYKHNKTCQDRLLTIANRSLLSPNESTRCGALRCLSKLGLTLAGSDLAPLFVHSGGAGGTSSPSELAAAATRVASARPLDQSSSPTPPLHKGGPNLQSARDQQSQGLHSGATETAGTPQEAAPPPPSSSSSSSTAQVEAGPKLASSVDETPSVDAPARQRFGEEKIVQEGEEEEVGLERREEAVQKQNQQQQQQQEKEQEQEEKEQEHKQKQKQMQLLRTGGEIKLDSETPDIILMSLTSYLARETRDRSNGDLVFAQAMAECCAAFVNFTRLLDKGRLIISTHWLRSGLEALVRKTEDYTFDKRGDIGVVVRRAAIGALQELCNYLISINMSYPILYENKLLQRIASKMLQQCLSYNDSARELAAVSFYRFISSLSMGEDKALRNMVPHYDEICDLFEKYQVGEQFIWRDDSTVIFVQLLAKEEYAQDLWLGLIPAVGQASELCARQFRDSLADYIRANLLNEGLSSSGAGGNYSTKEQQKQEQQQQQQQQQQDPEKKRMEQEANKERWLEWGRRKELHKQVFESFLQVFEQAAAWARESESEKEKEKKEKKENEKEKENEGQKEKQQQRQRPVQYAMMSQQRLLTSCLQTLDFLLTQGLMNETSSEFQERLVALCWSASNDSKRLTLVSRVLCSMLQFQSHKCLQYCLSLLVSRYPTVRAATAEQLYSNLMLLQLDGLDDGQALEGEQEGAEGKQRHLEEAMELLSQTQWTESLEKVQPIREKIRSCLTVLYPIDQCEPKSELSKLAESELN